MPDWILRLEAWMFYSGLDFTLNGGSGCLALVPSWAKNYHSASQLTKPSNRFSRNIAPVLSNLARFLFKNSEFSPDSLHSYFALYNDKGLVNKTKQELLFLFFWYEFIISENKILQIWQHCIAMCIALDNNVILKYFAVELHQKEAPGPKPTSHRWKVLQKHVKQEWRWQL